MICGFVYFCKAHEKQQVFMQTVKCVCLCVCVFVCVCVCVCEREREGERESSLGIHFLSRRGFLFSFFVFEWGRREGSVPRQPVRQAIAGGSL